MPDATSTVRARAVLLASGDMSIDDTARPASAHTVTMVGLGRMGSGMARSLLRAGHDVVVTNRTRARAEPLIELGARWADTPAEAVAGAAAVVVMVSDDVASRETWLGERGVLAGRPSPGALAIECSTLSHDWVRELSGTVAERGLRYLDAPVTGLPDAAAAGALTLLVGAEPQTLEDARPLLSAIADRVLYFGDAGTGTAYKLIVNLLGAVQIASVAESLAIAERAGLDPAAVAEAIASGQAASPQVVRTSRRMVIGDHENDVQFSGVLRRKDADYALRLAARLGVGAPFGRLALDGLDALVASGRGEANETSIIEIARTRR